MKSGCPGLQPRVAHPFLLAHGGKAHSVSSNRDWPARGTWGRNAKSGDLHLYPGFILCRAAREACSLIEYHDVSRETLTVNFHEEEQVPADSKVKGST